MRTSTRSAHPAARPSASPAGTRPSSSALPLSFGLLAASALISVVLAFSEVRVVSRDSLLPIAALTTALAAVRIGWWREETAGGPDASASSETERRRICYFWANLLLAGAAIAFSPIFGLYLFMGYYEAARSRVRAQHWAGMIGTALVIAVAQLGGPTSPIFTLPIYLLFVAINIGIASVMLVLDRNREALMDELAA
ncbi:MAG TPA: hypothetical protein GX743_06100, partial [Actinomycetales bacterium]|nr:hypothetical protein [Actinomycetales bacterium]